MLKEDRRNPFKPLPHKEFVELKKSIERHGVLIPLIVFQEKNGQYAVISGRNRLRAVRELKKNLVPCIAVSVADVNAVFETEIYRRHLKPEEKEKYKVKIEKVYKEIIEGEIHDRFPVDLLEEYKSKKLDFEHAVIMIRNQYYKDFYKFFRNRVIEYGIKELEEELKVEKESGKEESELEEKESETDGELSKGEENSSEELSRLKGEIEKYKKKKEDLERQLEEEKKKLKGASNEIEKKEHENRIKELEKSLSNIDNVNEKLREMVRKAQEEKEKVEEEARAKERVMKNEEIELKARKILHNEVEREVNLKTICSRFDYIINEIEILKEIIKIPFTQKDLSKIEEVVIKVKDKLDEFLNYTKDFEKISINKLNDELKHLWYNKGVMR